MIEMNNIKTPFYNYFYNSRMKIKKTKNGYKNKKNYKTKKISTTNAKL